MSESLDAALYTGNSDQMKLILAKLLSH